MKTKSIKFLKIAAFFAAAFSFIFILGACEDVSETPEDPDSSEDMYFEEKEIEEDHTVGSTACPQNLASLNIWPSGENGTLEKADSCTVSDNSNYIDTYFNDDKNSGECSLEDNNSCTLNVEFNCGQAEDVEAEMECTFYKDNVEVYRKKVPIKVNVKN